MATTTLSPTAVFKGFDNNGLPLASGKLFTYQAGTTSKLASYTDSTGGTPNTNPVILNARGEANVWIPPNVAYKYVLAPSTDTDPPSNPIWTVDQVVNSQLLTLYGGVDTGIVNAYVLNFSANFTSYSDGIIIYWIPANTNTGASTINVNGLGVVSIVNSDGSALLANEIIANQPAQIFYKGGVFQLITPAVTAYGTFTPTWTGFSVAPVGNVSYRVTGHVVTLTFTGSGTSNATNFVMSGLPARLRPSLLNQIVPVVGMIDSSANLTGVSAAQISGISFQITFNKDGGLTNNWTNSGTKGFNTSVVLSYAL